MPSMIELIGFMTSIAGVFLTIRRSPYCWPIGALSVLVYAYVFMQAKLYADAGLQGIFFLFCIYGWFMWTTSSTDANRISSPVQVSSMNKQEALLGIIGVLPCTFILGMFLNNSTDADIPYIDSFLAVVSIYAQFLQTRKRIQHWYMWILVDTLYIGLYIYKNLLLTAILYAIFLLMAIQGIIEWKKVLRTPTEYFPQKS